MRQELVMAGPVESEWNMEIGRRLRRLRRAFGFKTAADFAADLGVEQRRVQDLERGKTRVTEWLLQAVSQRTSGAAEWLFMGNDSFISPGVQERLRAATDAPRKRRKHEIDAETASAEN